MSTICYYCGENVNKTEAFKVSSVDFIERTEKVAPAAVKNIQDEEEMVCNQCLQIVEAIELALLQLIRRGSMYQRQAHNQSVDTETCVVTKNVKDEPPEHQIASSQDAKGITPVPPDNLLIWRNLINLEKSNLFSKSVNSFDNSEALEDKHSKQNLKENHEEWSCSENKSPQVGKTKKQHIGRARARVKKQVTICSTQNRDKTQPRTRNKNCQVCQISFNNTSKLKQHVEEHHKEAKVTCEICQKDFGKLTIHNHIKLHNKSSGHDKLSEKEPCDLCGERFNKRSLRRHMMTVHSSQPPQDISSGLCDICGKVLQDARSLRKHRDQIHLDLRVPCRICGEMVKKGSLPQHIKGLHEGIKRKKSEIKPCPNCGRMFPSNCLKVHIAAQHQNIKYNCNVCKKQFPYKHDLKAHMLNIHQGIKKYQCQYCEKSFSCGGNRMKHYRSTHKLEWNKEQNDVKSELITVKNTNLIQTGDLDKGMSRQYLDKPLRICDKMITLVSSNIDDNQPKENGDFIGVLPALPVHSSLEPLTLNSSPLVEAAFASGTIASSIVAFL